jgi:hypothetical protein
MMAGVSSPPYDLPPEECVLLVCSYIDSLMLASSPPPPQDPLPTPPDDNPHDEHNLNHGDEEMQQDTPVSEEGECPPPPAPPRRSLDYVAERPNGAIAHVLGEEFGIGVGYAELDLQHQKQRLALRFSSKEVPKISILDYLER